MYDKTYSELSELLTLKERFEYLKLSGVVGEQTFGSGRLLNQSFYSSKEWHDVRNEVILRDSGCDLGILDFPLNYRTTIHHINPITIRDIKEENWNKLFDPENLITVSFQTHNAIHFGNINGLPQLPIERKPGDTCLWR